MQAFVTPAPLLTRRRALTTLTATPLRAHRAAAPRRRPATTMAAAAAAAAATDNKMLHAVYRVGDLAATRRFLEALGMHVLRERDVPAGKYTNVFYGFGPERRGEHFSLELTYNYGVASYDLGTAFGHVAVAVPDLPAAVARVRAAGFRVDPAEPAPAPPAPPAAVARDPLGFCFRLVERVQRDPLAGLMLRVRDLPASVRFYETLGMRRLDSPAAAPSSSPSSAVLSFADDEAAAATLQLVVDPAVPHLTPGDAYAQIAISTPDVYAAAKRFEQAGIALAREPGPVPGIGTKICAVRDPDGWKTVLVDAEDFEKEFDE